MLKPLPRVRDLSEFRERFFVHDRAVVVTGAIDAMPARRWTPAYLADILGAHRPTVRLGNGMLAHMNMRDFLRYFESADSIASSYGPAYLKDFYIMPSFGDAARAAVGAEIRYPLVDAAEWPEWRKAHRGWNSLYIGPAGSRSSLHVDVYATNTWLAQIAGLKEWRLAEPQAIDPEVAARTDPFADADLPCDFYEAALEPGDVIYLPPNWWHAVENKTASMSVSGNFCTVDHAKACLAEVRAMANGSERDVWLKTWEAVLAEGAALAS